MLHNGQAEPGSALVTRTAFVHPVEAFKKPGNMLRLNPDAVVVYLDHDAGFHVVDAYIGSPARLSVFDGIHQQIHQHLPDPFLIGKHKAGSLAVVLRCQGNVAFAGLQLERLKHIFHQVGDVEGALFEDHLARLQLGDRLQVVDDQAEAFDGTRRPLQVLDVDVLVLHSSVQERMDVSLDVEDGRLQFVRDVSQELFAEGFGLAEFFDFFAAVALPVLDFAVHIADDVGVQVDFLQRLFPAHLPAQDGLVDDLYFPVDKYFNQVNDHQVGGGKGHQDHQHV